MQAHLDAADAQRALEGGAERVVDHLLEQPHPIWRARPLLVQLGGEVEAVGGPGQQQEPDAVPCIAQVGA